MSSTRMVRINTDKYLDGFLGFLWLNLRFVLQCYFAKRREIVVRRNQCEYGKNTGNIENNLRTIRIVAHI